MPSPIAHAAAGYAIYKLYASRKFTRPLPKLDPAPLLLIFVIALSFLPDFDFVPGFLLGDYSQFHNSYSNSLIVGLVVALVAGLAAYLRRPSRASLWFTVVLLAYGLHVLMDYLGAGRGVMLFWPLTGDRFISPVKLFYGLHRSDGLVSVRHIWTLLTETAFAIGVYGAVKLLSSRRLSLFLRVPFGQSERQPEEK